LHVARLSMKKGFGVAFASASQRLNSAALSASAPENGDHQSVSRPLSFAGSVMAH